MRIQNTPLLILSSRPKTKPLNPPWQSTVWTCNAGFRFVTRVDRLFEMHDYYWRQKVYAPLYEYISEYPSLHMPIYMLQHYPEIPASVAYPYSLVRDWASSLTGLAERQLFSSTAAYMIALALWEGWKRIEVRDFKEMVREVAQNLSMWYGIAWGMDVELTITWDTFLNGKYIYGYQESEYIPKAGKWDIGVKLEEKKK